MDAADALDVTENQARAVEALRMELKAVEEGEELGVIKEMDQVEGRAPADRWWDTAVAWLRTVVRASGGA